MYCRDVRNVHRIRVIYIWLIAGRAHIDRKSHKARIWHELCSGTVWEVMTSSTVYYHYLIHFSKLRKYDICTSQAMQCNGSKKIGPIFVRNTGCVCLMRAPSCMICFRCIFMTQFSTKNNILLSMHLCHIILLLKIASEPKLQNSIQARPEASTVTPETL